MHDTPDDISPLPSPQESPGPQLNSSDLRKFTVSVIGLIAVFALPLYDLVRFALQSELFSHVLLVPFISLYLVWVKRHKLPPPFPPDRRLVILPLLVGGALLAIGLTSELNPTDSLAYSILSLVLLFSGICACFFGPPTLRALSFPLAFLLLMAPFPTAVTTWIETALQNYSASAASLFFTLGGTTFFRQDTYFELPGMKLFVAPECSGIHSTLALFITSLLAGYVFLRSPAKRALLTLAIIPLAIVRNGFRVFVIGELCVRIGPEMIDSYIHRQGGPIFFTLSLLPFSLIMLLLIRSEKRRAKAASATT